MKLTKPQQAALMSLLDQEQPQQLREDTGQALVNRQLAERWLVRGWGYGYVLTSAGRDMAMKQAKRAA